MLIVSIFTGIYYWIMKTDVGYAITHAIRQPLFSALLIGLIMGDVKQAVIIGAAVQILYIGLVAAGSNLPADDCLAGGISAGKRTDRCADVRGWRGRDTLSERRYPVVGLSGGSAHRYGI